MLATLVIGLREGLEASLIVGIIAAFLRRAGKPLRPMWIGVGIAITMSIAVGVALQLVSASLPQAQQEGMESLIGLAAVIVVTGMIGWMNAHARNLRAELEQHTASALNDGTAWALVGMAFLAVLKEGFETSVFLLAAFQSSTSFLGASAGAVIGVALAIAIGIGVFRGGIRLNLARFFRITGIFLVLVAAGLVLSSTRAAHEAGWILIGQQPTITLSWLAPAGSVQAALLTGVLGIPADPRLIEVVGWFAYLVPTMAFLLWPTRRRPSGRSLVIVRLGIAGALVVIAGVLALAVALPTYSPASAVSVSGPNGTSGILTVDSRAARYSVSTDSGSGRSVGASGAGSETPTMHEGIPSRQVQWKTTGTTPDQPTTLTLSQLVTIEGGRLPIGVNASQNPGPFAASWRTTSVTSVWIYRGGILDAQRSAHTVVTLTGGGLPNSRTISPGTTNSPATAQTDTWRLSSADRAEILTGITRAAASRSELLLWKLWIPIVLVLAAVVLVLHTLHSASPKSPPTRNSNPSHETKKETYA